MSLPFVQFVQEWAHKDRNWPRFSRTLLRKYSHAQSTIPLKSNTPEMSSILFNLLRSEVGRAFMCSKSCEYPGISPLRGGVFDRLRIDLSSSRPGSNALGRPWTCKGSARLRSTTRESAGLRQLQQHVRGTSNNPTTAACHFREQRRILENWQQIQHRRVWIIYCLVIFVACTRHCRPHRAKTRPLHNPVRTGQAPRPTPINTGDNGPNSKKKSKSFHTITDAPCASLASVSSSSWLGVKQLFSIELAGLATLLLQWRRAIEILSFILFTSNLARKYWAKPAEKLYDNQYMS